MDILTFRKIKQGTYECELNLNALYKDETELEKFNKKWIAFLNSDHWNKKVFKRDGNTIKYSHKSWVPEKNDNRIPILIVAGNPAPQSTSEDVYYAFETNGSEHRFWKILRKLGFIDLPFDLKLMKSTFFDLDYVSPFRIGIDVTFTFPSSASAQSWSGVQGLQKLFGVKALEKIFLSEKVRIQKLVTGFFKDNIVTIIAVQKDAYNMFAKNTYSLNKAVIGKLSSIYDLEGRDFRIYGAPPTRWMYTTKMQSALLQIKKDILNKKTGKNKLSK
ncbi:hypothetical protein COT48_00005 [Candidatus Woesearchaeota archaeon CG08_land_8_20_14_0_20_47_9]|nr:MAG: hypothetical protein COT48_00005 [Candidatus Woesearchaeota archaeon CG08_land_8_20_14_0_20_47_9]